jgi:4-hydroxybenzoyl-CoA reductase alpha subunit
MAEFSVIGKRVPRVDAREKVTGQAKYAADYSLPGMLWCKLLRSPHPHARILNIDTSLAAKYPGVKAIITGKDFNGWTWGWQASSRDEPPMAVDKVRYLAEAVAAVAATDENIAEAACELIKVDYAELPGVFDPEESMKEGAPVIHDYVKNNISVQYHWNFGDVEKAFSESYLVREDKFRTARATHGYVEPPATLADYNSAGNITVWPSKQSPYFHYRHLAACFKLPLNRVRVIQPFIGGGFGGTKNDSLAGDFAAVLLSKMTGRPVKWVENMEEELMTSRRRHIMTVYSKMGMDKEGHITALQHRVVADGGGYTAIGPLSMYLAGIITTLPYKLPNFKYDVFRAFTNNPVGAAMRGHGITHSRFAAEVQMEMMAIELGIDPVEVRMRNAIDNPPPGQSYMTINQIPVKTCGLKEAIQKAAADRIWQSRGKTNPGDDHLAWGVGMSCASYQGGARQQGHQSCSAIVRICEDGTVNLMTGATDCGQGSDTVLSMIAAEELGVKLEKIDFKRVDSAYTPVDPGSYGSRVTVLAGQAVQKACRIARQQLVEAAAKLWQVKPEEIEIRQDIAVVKGHKDQMMPFDRLARIACYSGTGAVILGTGYSHYGLDPYDLAQGFGGGGTSFSFTAQTSKVGVDLETGKIAVTDFTLASDCGRLLSPLQAEGQIEGGAIQGMGQALYENFEMAKGRTLNPTLLDYKMPLSTDVPNIHLIDIETNDPEGPFGAKEASEASIVSSPPSLVSALHDATGIWFKELPVTPEKIHMALKQKSSQS